jgi:Tfp pilus assembly protein PilE
MRVGIKQKGFAIIELTAIVVALSMLGYFAYLSWAIGGEKTRDTGRIETVNKVHQGLIQYLEEHKQMPANQDGFSPTCSDDSRFLEELQDNGLLPRLPKDPKKHEYCYFDYGANTLEGAVVGVELEQLFIEDSPCPRSAKLDWCLETYYCLCQPYQFIKK